MHAVAPVKIQQHVVHQTCKLNLVFVVYFKLQNRIMNTKTLQAYNRGECTADIPMKLQCTHIMILQLTGYLLCV